jgi:hypothetical protein
MSEVEVRPRTDSLTPVKESPRKMDGKKMEFEWLVEGFAKPSQTPELRFRVYSQERKVHNDLSPEVARTLLRLWQLNYTQFGYEHRPDYNKSTVDVYLCWAGLAGGEQLFDFDPQAPRGTSSKVNTIYIYDLPSFTEPIEKLREVAHEYGHASLPAVGGYDQPEYWANGYLGEKIFLTELGKAGEGGFLDCSADDIKSWVRKECDPLVIRGASYFPALQGKTANAMKQYIGTMLWAHRILPYDTFGRAFKATGGLAPADVPSALAEAIEGADPFEFTVPKSLVGKPIWVPFARMKMPGQTVKLRKSGWAQFVPTQEKIKVLP